MDSVSPGLPAVLPIRVYYEDTDTGGVVYYANYLRFFERARTEWLRALGLNQSELAAGQRLLFVVRHADITYHRAARLDDRIEIHTRSAAPGASSILFTQDAWRDQDLLVAAQVQICTVHADTFKPVRLPPVVRNLLEKARN